MAEFDKRGFAAVDAFFGGASTADRAAASLHHTQQQESVGPRHLGLGATTSAKARSNEHGMNKRILQVGRKRQRDVSDDDDKSSEVSGEDQEEDLGRTAIDQNQPSTVPVSAVALAKEVVAGRKKKKKGKKERALDRATKERQEDDAVATRDEEPNDSNEKSLDSEGVDGKSKKRKRRKVRSRQKNIYKDKREKKPEHLVPGNKNYQGRPLTAETRTKLNLGPARSVTVKESRGDWENSWTEGPQDSSIDALPLAVDAPRAETGTSMENRAERLASTSNTRSKKKKSKYKNLR